MTAINHPILSGVIHWLSPAEGGRRQRPVSGVYAPTAHFRDEDVSALFGLVLYLEPAPGPHATEVTHADARLLAPESFTPDRLQKFYRASRLVITEGPQAVAEFRVTSAVPAEVLNDVDMESQQRLHQLRARHQALVHAAESVQAAIDGMVKRAG